MSASIMTSVVPLVAIWWREHRRHHRRSQPPSTSNDGAGGVEERAGSNSACRGRRAVAHASQARPAAPQRSAASINELGHGSHTFQSHVAVPARDVDDEVSDLVDASYVTGEQDAGGVGVFDDGERVAGFFEFLLIALGASHAPLAELLALRARPARSPAPPSLALGVPTGSSEPSPWRRS